MEMMACWNNLKLSWMWPLYIDRKPRIISQAHQKTHH